jgi:hypothetical protein
VATGMTTSHPRIKERRNTSDSRCDPVIGLIWL